MVPPGPRPASELGSANGGMTATGSEYQFAQPSSQHHPMVSPNWTTQSRVSTLSNQPVASSHTTNTPTLADLRAYQHQMLANLQQHMDEIRLLSNQSQMTYPSASPSGHIPTVLDMGALPSPATSGITEGIASPSRIQRPDVVVETVFTDSQDSSTPPEEEPLLIDLLDIGPQPRASPVPSRSLTDYHRAFPDGTDLWTPSFTPVASGRPSAWVPDPGATRPGIPPRPPSIHPPMTTHLPSPPLPTSFPDPGLTRPVPLADPPFTEVCANGSVRVHSSSSSSLGGSTTSSQAAEDSKLRKASRQDQLNYGDIDR